MLGKAIKLAAEKFENKKDRGGQPYILHCLRVMNNLHTEDEELKCIAVLHDIYEDTDLEPGDLLKLGFTERVENGVYTLTHLDIHTYDEYIKRVSEVEDATKVKREDLKDNSDITRLKGLRKKDFERVEKYHKAFVYLS